MAAPTPKKISAKPEAELAPRRGDQLLSSAELQQFELFGQLKKAISVEKFPGSIVLRKFRRGETICRQGDRGHSAFYIASSQDMRRLETLRAGGDSEPVPHVDGADKRRVATTYLLSGAAVARPGFFSRLLPARRRAAKKGQPASIPNDGPTDIDYDTRQAPMWEGDVFGEMSCMTLSPRSATVVADDDCYMIEFLRNIFDKVQSDAGYRKRADEVYAKRVLSSHLGRLEIFQGLSEPQLAILRDAAQLEVVEPGTVICDEGDRSDSVYLIRSGVVQVVRGLHVAWQVSDVADWPSFCQALLAAIEDGPVGGSQGDDPKTSPANAPPAKPAAPAGVADLPAAARGGAGKSGPTKRGGASVADILAATRGGKKPGEAPPAAKAPATSPDSEKAHPAQTKPAMPADILAAARAAASPQDRPAAKPAKSKTSTADILAAAKKQPPGPASAAKSPPPAAHDDDPAAVLRATPPPPTGQPRRCVWDWFTPDVQAAIRSIAAAEPPADPRQWLRKVAQNRVIRALNQLTCRRDFVASKDIAPIMEQADVGNIVSSFPQGSAGVSKHWSDVDVRVAGKSVLRAIFPEALLQTTQRKATPDILAYLSRGDCFGEMALVLDAPRQATCIAYDHPADDSKRKPGRVELVRIDGEAFRKLLDTSEPLQAKVDQLVSARYVDIVGGDLREVGTTDPSLSHSAAFQDQGLAQGQSLLLIDLDRCTRCGDCVRACQNTHDDGQSRLFLDGPRFDRFLIPSACRQCLNPACMIGCPVGSIQRGDNGQIEIRDWCIGCKLCADQCPYDSIQMHDIGIIPEQSVGWQLAPASAITGKNWQARGYRGRKWSTGLAPFQWTLDLFEQLAARAREGVWHAENGCLPEPIYFRYPFHMSRAQYKKGAFNLLVASSRFEVRVWVNGTAVVAEEPANPKKKKKLDEVQARLDTSDLRVGLNVLAVQISPAKQAAGGDFVPKYNQPVLTARLDVLPRAGDLATATAGEGVDLEVELVKRQAVVCDLCSSLARRRPACVDQCPHEAAIRINAQIEFPAT